MKKQKSTFILLVLMALSLNAQNNAITSIPQESVYLQYNESLLFSGEHLKYKIYCLDKSKRTLTRVSKMGYVSLINKTGEVVFVHKIKLTDGSGYGDFFVPTSVPTGSYKLLGYSEWMKNFGREDFFQSDIHIINPYQVTEEAYLEQPMDSLNPVATRSIKQPITNGNRNLNKNSLLCLALDKPISGKREKVALTISGTDASTFTGDYNISIRKVDSISSPPQISAEFFFSEMLKRGKNASTPNGVVNLPELRGEIISGVITTKDSNLPAENLRISLSLPGDKYLFKVATSDSEGKFRFILDREYDNLSGALQILSDDLDKYEVTMDTQKIDRSGIQFTDFVLTKRLKDYILEKSIQNQIENAYRATKSDSIVPANHVAPFYRKFTTSYDLDDYTRFNSLQETIVEVVDQVGIRKLSNGDQVFEVRPEIGYTDNSLLPMVFIDGLFIKKHQDFMDYSSKKIKTISFSRDKVIVGSQVFQGVILFETIDGGFYNDFYTPHILNVDLFKPQSRKDYYIQQYSDNAAQKRIPDFRQQLLWEPDLDLSAGEKEVVFYTSDISGQYEVVLEGFTSLGRPVSVKEKFVVE